jgi:hypothetical protein
MPLYPSEQAAWLRHFTGLDDANAVATPSTTNQHMTFDYAATEERILATLDIETTPILPSDTDLLRTQLAGYATGRWAVPTPAPSRFMSGSWTAPNDNRTMPSPRPPSGDKMYDITVTSVGANSPVRSYDTKKGDVMVGVDGSYEGQVLINTGGRILNLSNLGGSTRDPYDMPGNFRVLGPNEAITLIVRG